MHTHTAQLEVLIYLFNLCAAAIYNIPGVLCIFSAMKSSKTNENCHTENEHISLLSSPMLIIVTLYIYIYIYILDHVLFQVNIVDPLKLTEEFGNILADTTIATNVQATIILHKGLYVVYILVF